MSTWRLLPTDFPPWGTIYRWFATFRDDGRFEAINHKLVMADRERIGADAVGVEKRLAAVRAVGDLRDVRAHHLLGSVAQLFHTRGHHLVAVAVGVLVGLFVAAVVADGWAVAAGVGAAVSDGAGATEGPTVGNALTAGGDEVAGPGVDGTVWGPLPKRPLRIPRLKRTRSAPPTQPHCHHPRSL